MLNPLVDRPTPDNAVEQHTKQVLTLAVRAGELMMSSGAETTRVEETVNIIARSFGFARPSALVTPTGIYVSLDDERLALPVTRVLRVAGGAPQFSRIFALNDLSRQIAGGSLTLDEAQQRLERIAATPDPYPFWLWVLAGAAAAAGIALLLGGTALDMVPGFVSTVLVLLIGAWLERFNVPAFFIDMLGAALAGAVALGLVAMGLPIHAGFAIAGGIMKLVPGSALLTAVQDGIYGNLLSAGARGLETLIKAAALASGVGAALAVGLSLGINVSVENSGGASWQAPIQVAAALAASVAYAVSYYVPRFAILSAGVTGATGWLVFLLLLQDENWALPATFIAAVVVGVLSWGFARWQHAPITLFVLPGIVPLLPGVTIFNGMLDLSRGDGLPGLLTLVHALFLGGALAAGVALSNAVAPSIWKRRWVRGPQMP